MRLFVAIELEARARQFLQRAQESLSAYDRLVRWARPAQMHLTLKFLGHVPDDQVDAACSAARRAVEGFRPFEMTLGGFGCFPESGRARIVWAGIQAPSGTLPTCQQRLDEEFLTLGFEPEKRAYAAHITVARVRQDTSRGELRRAVEGLPAGNFVQPVDAVVMMESVLMRNGAVYTPVARWSLAQRSLAPSLSKERQSSK